MKIGQNYRLTAEGISTLMLLNSANRHQIPFDANTRITIIGPFQKCTCGSKIDRHTDDCASHYVKAKLPSGDWFMACASDLHE